jgi:signal peptide peptidase SppA
MENEKGGFLNKVPAAGKLILIALAFMVLSTLSYAVYDGWIKTPVVATSDEYSDEYCSVLGINLHGMLLTYVPPYSEDNPLSDPDVRASEEVMYLINQANADDDIKAIVLEVDSSGGLPVAGEEIANALKNSSKPTVGFIRSSGLSAAYWAVSGTDHIIASRNSDVGSIGVTLSYLDNVGKNQKDGNTYMQLSSGKYKDAGDPDRPLTEEEKQLFLRDIKILHENFIADVAANRNVPVADIQKIADGSSVLGDQAKALHLIDEIGGLPEVEKYLEGIIGERPEICWY